MFRITGRISSKAIIRQGVSRFGNWKIMRFTITKQHNKEKVQFCFTAKGKLAELVNKLEYNERVEINFFPKCEHVGERWFTELMAVDVEIYVGKQRYDQYLEQEETIVDVDFCDDLNLQEKMK